MYNNLNTKYNYYPFGSVIPGRSFTSGSYRYGFNSHEKDNEIKGVGNSYDFGARMNDPRLGRFLSMDAAHKEDPDLTPYRFGLNSPISYFDPDGNYEADGTMSKKQKKEVSTAARAEANKTKEKYAVVYERMKTAKETENVNKIVAVIDEAKKTLDGNANAKEAFQQLTGSKEGTNRYDNFFVKNGKGPKINLTDVGFSGNTSEDGITLNTNKSYLSHTILHEYIHYAGLNKSLRLFFKGGGDGTENGYKNLVVGGTVISKTDQLNIIVRAYKDIEAMGGDMTKFRNKAYPGFLKYDKKTGNVTGLKVEGGYLFEYLGFGAIKYEK